jgi:hypothetical protein
MARKRTESVQLQLDIINRFMRESPAELREARSLLASVTESMLMAHGCYRGFNYIYWLDGGFREWELSGRPDFPEKDYFIYGPSGDATRIQYY